MGGGVRGGARGQRTQRDDGKQSANGAVLRSDLGGDPRGG
ncbi:hypothetical protein D187_009135 [Cystobacter fuscus DSM 2262]|uniref:Uncharacterized protein n=1 Tax=Cystobacter fuscus (strain ATCC 25194 / DSM 2262 / NBRC 100088 / M29) TaxID=1242864 RepID=S9Q2L1_CYSF2|nr:hypothetical protein D187_009135 [Cystobacter fuscus DSM 2262]